MSFETRWYIEKRVVYQEWHGKITIEEFIKSRDQLLNMFPQGIAPVHCIVSLVDVESYPSLLEMQKHSSRQMLAEMGWTILVINNSVIRFIAVLLVQLATKQFRVVGTLSEGLTFIGERDNTIHLI